MSDDAQITFGFANHEYTATVHNLDSLAKWAAENSFLSASVDSAGRFELADLLAAIGQEDETEDEETEAYEPNRWAAWVLEDKNGNMRTSAGHRLNAADLPTCGARPKRRAYDWIPTGGMHEHGACKACARGVGLRST
jgi:hypothetical protein